MISQSLTRIVFCFIVTLLLGTSSRADTNIVSQFITGVETWYRTNVYQLNGAVFVRSNAVLNIESGTVIKGNNLGTFGTNVAALYVCRGAKIMAQGTAQAPIIFTTVGDDTTLPDDMGLYQRGLWGGVVILGRTTINGALDANGNAASPKYEVYEGLQDLVINAAGDLQVGGEGEGLFRYGGNDDADNSGVLHYVSIRHGGAKLSTDKEINGLSLGAVGSGTTIEYVEAYAIADDGFEFFGGTVNTRYLVSAFCDDDTFDADMGFRGKNQFWFAIQAPDARNYGMELNNQINEIATPDKLLPASDFKIYNATMIGSGTANTVTTGGRNGAFNLRPYVGVTVHNSIFTDYNERAIELDTRNSVSAANVVTNTANFSNNLWWGFVTGSGSGNVDNSIGNISRETLASNYWTITDLVNEIVDPMLNSISRTNEGALLDPRPQFGSPVFADYATPPNDGFYTQAPYRGAFNAQNLWVAGWTALSEYGILSTEVIGPPVIEVPQFITGTANWYRTNIYQLNGAVFVRSNAVLNIEAGTVIKGNNLGTFGTNVAALYVCRGGKIFAEGTPQKPIIFTAAADDTTLPDDMGLYQRGLWGGVVILGRTTINGALDANGNAASPKYEVYEGLQDLVINAAGDLQVGGEGEGLFRYGGSDDADNSGVFRYVSIRHGGAKLSTDKEINGLSLGAVGSGTTIEFVEAYAIADDGFEFFGGTVNTKYLVSAFCDDDTFDADMGFRGKNQFWFGIQAPDARNYGMELNNQINEIATPDKLLPASDFEIYNATMIGSGAANTVTTGGRNGAFNLRPYVGVTVYNSIFTDYNERAVELDTRNSVSAANVVTNTVNFYNNLWWGFVTGSGSGNVDNSVTNISRETIASNFWTITELTNQIADPMLNSISRTNVDVTLDPRPQPGSPALTDYATAPNDGFYSAANYRGAFDSNNLWIAGWTALSEYGIVAPAGQQVVEAPQFITGTVNWYRTNVYQLNGAVFVRSNAVLNVEAGTVIKGNSLGTFGTNVAALYVCRGGKIFANGSPQNPIIFTALADDLTLPDDLGIYQRGLWGGVVILGRTTINGALDANGNAASPKYEVYEGLQDLVINAAGELQVGGEGEGLFRFGGSDDTDNSGVLRYVSIRHGGAKLSTDKEINGLSLGAVGSGTTIEFVESYAIADDGFEFFGGTVNTKHLVSAFCDDDTFDTDMGYRGKNQFWFGIQAPDARNYGMEVNNQINEIATPDKLLPASDFKIYNATMIGSGTANTVTTGGRNAAFNLRPYLGMTVYNSIFTDYNERAIELDTRNGVSAANVVTNTVNFYNNLWWGFVTGSGSGNVDNSIENISRATLASNYWTITELVNQIANPMLISISRTNVDQILDPRPQLGSPAFSNHAPVPNDGFLSPVNYRGAFGPGRSNWASDWTALAEYSILTSAGAGVLSAPVASGPEEPSVDIVQNGSNVDVTFDTQVGFTYQPQSTTSLSGQINWSNEGAPINGNGSPVTISVPVTGDQKFIQVRVQ